MFGIVMLVVYSLFKVSKERHRRDEERTREMKDVRRGMREGRGDGEGRRRRRKEESKVKDDAKFFNFCNWKCIVHINKRGRKTASGKSLKERSRFQFHTCSI